jgi:hypothetical protein
MSDPTRKETEKPSPPEEEPLTSGFRTEGMEGAAAAAAEAAVTYQFTVYTSFAVYTSNIPYAGTDGDVWVWVDGTGGRSGWLYLDNFEDNFETNKTDYFYFSLPDLGYLSAAWVYFRPLGFNSAWHLATVSVNGRTFTYNQWIVAEGMYRLNAT